ncbi:methyltransferase domain-containing protein [Candidatus Woesearchaeota archaeon]|nr:methyltransferase domain-containing protein [Candidatus Woesearchaeota archaeon]
MTKFKVSDIDRFYNDFYDPDRRELQKILSVTRPKDRTVLEIGCKTGSLSIYLLDYASKILGVDHDRELIAYANKKKSKLPKEEQKKLNFRALKTESLSSLKGTYEVIISNWASLHQIEDKKNLVSALFKLLDPYGVLLIIEPNPQSEFIRVLDVLVPVEDYDMPKLLKELHSALDKRLITKEQQLNTFYLFEKKSQVLDYFKKELEYEEGREFTKEMQTSIERYMASKKQFLIGEKATLYICKKKVKLGF